MGKFKISKMNQGGYDVAYGDSYFTFPSAPTPVAAAVAGMQAVLAENPGVLPIDLVKSLDDRALQQGVIKQWTSLVKSGQGAGVPTPQAPRPQQFPAQVQPQARMPQPANAVPVVTREQAMAFLDFKMEALYRAQRDKDMGTLQKTDRGLAGALSTSQLEGPGAINALLKSLNTTRIRIAMMPAEIAAAAPTAQAQGQQIPTPEEYFQSHPMYPPLARDVQKWLDAGGGQE